jgi:CheY-like chemotaxis protein
MMQKHTILVIDREDATRSLISDLVGIRYKNIRVISTKELGLAIEHMEKEAIDLVMMDVHFLKNPAQDNAGVLEVLSSKTKATPAISLTGKNAPEIGTTISFSDNLNKPFKPASLFLIIDKYLTEKETGLTEEELFTKPDWANFRHIDVRVLCQTYSCKKEKAIKILKLYPDHINPQLHKISQSFRNKKHSCLLEDFQSLRTSFIYFSGKEVVATIDKIIESIEKKEFVLGLNSFEQLKSQWSFMANEIENI